MAVEDWIDQIAALAGEVAAPRGGYVRSYTLDAFPESISAVPCAISYTRDLLPSYSDSGPCLDIWHGVTEFHLALDASKQRYPEVMAYFALIKAAFAAHRTLGGRVAYCLIDNEAGGIKGPVALAYGGEEPHHGIIVYWMVKENTTGDFILGA